MHETDARTRSSWLTWRISVIVSSLGGVVADFGESETQLRVLIYRLSWAAIAVSRTTVLQNENSGSLGELNVTADKMYTLACRPRVRRN